MSEDNRQNPIERLLARLDNVKPRGEGRWIACCPAHPDRHPSLSIRYTSDGVILLKCWCGCTADEITAAVGLDLADLFPPDTSEGSPLPKHRRIPHADILLGLRHELLIVAAAADILLHRPLTADERARLKLASRRIHAGIDGGSDRG